MKFEDSKKRKRRGGAEREREGGRGREERESERERGKNARVRCQTSALWEKTDQLDLNPVRDLVDYARRNGLEKRAQSDA